MTISAKGVFTLERSSGDSGRRCGEEIAAALGQPKVVFCYLTVNHDQERFLEGLRRGLGADAHVIGCSGQGVMGKGRVVEVGYAASVLGLGGPGLEIATAFAEDIAEDPLAKGRALGRDLRRRLSAPPRAVVVNYDPLRGLDVDPFLKGVQAEIEAPIIGGAASHMYGQGKTTTFQYVGTRVLSGAAVAVALGGDGYDVEMDICTGCSPVGLEMKVTRAEGNLLLELDGRPAFDVWREISGAPKGLDTISTAALAVGVPVEGGGGDQLIRAAIAADAERRGMLLPAAIPTGTTVMLHHRTTHDVLDGARRLAGRVVSRLRGRTVRAALGFECGARTKPFLGDLTQRENEDLQRAIGPQAEWAGVICWGEIFPVARRAALHNYTFPVLLLVE